MNAARDLVRERGHTAAPALRPGGESGDKIAGKHRRNAGASDLLQARPGRHAVDLEHGRAPIRAVENIDSGKSRAHGGASHEPPAP